MNSNSVRKAKATRNGVIYNLHNSDYKVKINYTTNYYIIYHFSSELYRGKFIERMEDNRKSINGSLSNRFGFEIVCDPLCDIKLYSSIEKRGFLIKTNKEGFECLESLKLDGKSLITKS